MLNRKQSIKECFMLKLHGILTFFKVSKHRIECDQLICRSFVWMLQPYSNEKVCHLLFPIYVVIGQFSFKWPSSSGCTVMVII